MFRLTTPVHPFLWSSGLSRPKSLIHFCLLFCTIGWFSGLEARAITTIGQETGILSDTLILASICANETYLFDGEVLNTPGEYVATYLAADGTDSTVTLQLSVLSLSLTSLSASICEGENYSFEGQDLTQTGTYSATYAAANGCDSIITLNLTVLPPVNTSLSVALCDGSTYVFQGDTLSVSGEYAAVLTSADGCDSIVTLKLNLVSYFETAFEASICPGSSYHFAGDTLSLEGIYTDSLTASGGCDSIVTLTLRLLPTTSSELNVSICSGSFYSYNGDTLTQSGSYEYLFTGSNGCDSTVVVNFTLADFFDIQLEATICDGEVFIFDGDFLEFEGVYTYEYQAQGGCDSTVTFTLHVLPNAVGAGSASICAGGQYDFHGQILTDAGVYTFVLDAANGCDSTVTFTLNVLPVFETSLEATICNGETYDFNGNLLADAGIYTFIFESVNGCDSTANLMLTVLPVQETNFEASICTGDTYVYNGDTLSSAGTYAFVYTAENGCDSTVTLVLNLLPLQYTTIQATICEGDAYDFDDTLVTDSGTYTATYQSENGCDSIVTLVLELLPQQNTALEASICAYETYLFNGVELSTAGIYTNVLTGVNGCDSTVVLTLNILPTQNTLITATICEGGAYVYYGASLTTAGDYDFIFDSELGCDSTVTIRLTVLPVPKMTLSASICSGDFIEYNGDSLTVEGAYEFIFTAANGCDSIVTFNLTVRPLASSLTGISRCEGASYIFNGDTLSTSGIYNYTFTGSNGCDSTATLVLEFVGSFETNLQVAICIGTSYIFGNDTLTAAGDYSQLLTAQGGCDSLVNLVLSILTLSESINDISICEGESYSFNGLDLSTSGQYTALLTGANGCDSTAILNLTVLPVQGSVLEATICANETYAFNGLVLNDAGTYTAVLTGANGCDSTVVLTLNVLPTQSSNLSATICSNQTYDFEGQEVSVQGIYTAVLQSVNGCDSIITLELSVLPTAQSSFAVSVCDGETYAFNGQVLTQSGIYQAIYGNAATNGCDSIETLFLTIFEAIPPTNITGAICAGETYDFYGTSLTAAGTYSAALSSTLGCDSIIVLTLTVNPSPQTFGIETICAGESYLFNGQLLTVPGTYTAVFQTAAGCDSTVALTLLVNTVNVSVSVQNNTLTAAAANASYQWIDCANNQPIPGANGSSFSPATTGNYAVVVTENGCTATSTCVFVQIVSTNEPLGGAAWTLQPNPATDFARVVFSVEADEDLWLEVLDMSGRSLQQQNVAPGTRQLDLNLQSMPDGILIVRLANGHGVSAQRLIKGQR